MHNPTIGRKALIQSIVLQPAFEQQLNLFSRKQLNSAINTFLASDNDRPIPLKMKVYLNILKMPFCPLKLSKKILLKILREKSQDVISRVKGKIRRDSNHQAKKMMKRKLKIV